MASFGGTLGTATVEVEADLSKLDAQFAAAQRKWEQAAARIKVASRTALDPSTLTQELAGATGQAAQAADRVSAAFVGASRQSQFAIRNIAFQFSDLVVQVGAGTNVFRALAQQLPQVFAGFAPQVAIIGTLVATAVSLGVALLGLGRSAKETENAFKGEIDALRDLEERYRTAEGAAKAFAGTQVQASKSVIGRELVDQSRDAFERYEEVLQRLQRTAEAASSGDRDRILSIRALVAAFRETHDIETFREELQKLAAEAPGSAGQAMRELLAEVEKAGDSFLTAKDKLHQLASGADLEGLQKIREEFADINEELSRFGAAPPAGTEQRKRFDDLSEALDKAKLSKEQFDEAVKGGDTEVTGPVLKLVDEQSIKRQADSVDDLEKKVFDLGKTTERTRLPENLQAILGRLEQLRQKVAGQASKLDIHAEVDPQDRDSIQRDLEAIDKQLNTVSSTKRTINLDVEGPKRIREEIENLSGELAAMQLAPSAGEADKARQRYQDITAALKTLGKSMTDFQQNAGVKSQVLELVNVQDALRQQEAVTGFQKKIQDLRNAIVIANLPEHLKATAEAAADAGKSLDTGDWNGASQAIQNAAAQVGALNSQLKQVEFGQKLLDLQQDAQIANLPPELREAAKAAKEFGFTVGEIHPEVFDEIGERVNRINKENALGKLKDQIRELQNQDVIISAPTAEVRDMLQAVHDLGIDLSELHTPEELDAAIKRLGQDARETVDQFVAMKEEMKRVEVRRDLTDGIKKISDETKRAGVPEALQDWAEKAQKLGATFDALGKVDFSLVDPQDVEQLNELRDSLIGMEDVKLDFGLRDLRIDEKISKVPDELKLAARYALETGQFLDAAGNVDFSKLPADLKRASAESARITKELENRSRIEAGGRLPDKIDVANIAASELADTLTDVDNLSFDSLGEAFANIAKQITQMIIQALIFRAIMAAFGGGVAPTGPAPVGFAQGGVVQQPQRVVIPTRQGIAPTITYAPFAVGGIVPRLATPQSVLIPHATGSTTPQLILTPTVFPAAGGTSVLAGESGPEAILPLTRTTAGQLGVHTTGKQGGGGGGTVVFNIPDARPDTVAFALNQARRVFPQDMVDVTNRSPGTKARMGINRAPF